MDAKIVMSLETEEDIQLDTETALSFQDDVSYRQFRIGRLLKSKQDTPVSQFHYSSLKQEPAPRMHINLPKINIKSFGGDPLQWLTFWDSFSAAIDKNHGLSDIEKMNYLNGMLKGEAARAISGLPLTEENYKKGNWAITGALRQTTNFDERLHGVLIQDRRATSWHQKSQNVLRHLRGKHSRFRGTWSKNGNLWKLIDSHSSKENTRRNSVLNIQSWPFSGQFPWQIENCHATGNRNSREGPYVLSNTNHRGRSACANSWCSTNRYTTTTRNLQRQTKDT